MAPNPPTFPIQPTSFVGREEELTAIAQSLADPACRLLTLTGPGGVGKTRLAIQATLKAAGDFERGAFFVNLQPAEDADQLVSSISDSIGSPLSGQAEPRLQLFNYLSDKEMLLVLDNFEVLSTGAELISQLLQNAPAVKLLVTSRQALNLREEWLHPLAGMPYPTDDSLEADKIPTAIEFFVGCAQHLRPDFSLEAERGDVIRICQLVDGLPLALEMAASWTKTLRCADIATEIQRDLEFLTSNLRNTAPQHRSMQAVLDQSWKRLSSEEREVFKRMSVSAGGFDLQAAREISGATPSILARLVDKSILRVEVPGRYQMHELSRQYAKNKLDQNPDEAMQTQERFSCYYIEFTHTLESDLVAGRQKEATQEVKAELANIRKAWDWAIQTANIPAIEKSVIALSLFYQYQSRYLEGTRMLAEAEAVLRNQTPSKQRDLVLTALLCNLGWLNIRLGKITQAEQGLLEGKQLLEKHDARPILGNCYDPHIPLGVIASIRGDYAETRKLAEQVLHVSQAREEIWNEMDSYYLLTRAAILAGDFETAQGHAQKTYQLARQNQDHWFMAYCLNELGTVANALGNYAIARGHFQTSFQLREEFGDPEGMAVALNHLGDIALKEANFQRAQTYFQQSREIYQEINDQGGLATSLNGLACVALAQDDLPEAQLCFRMALQIGSEIQYLSLSTLILTGIAQLLVQVGKTGDVAQMLTLVINHPASERETVELAWKIARENKLEIKPFEAQPQDIEEFIAHILVWLPTLEIAAIPKTKPEVPAQPLIDPLTNRELEVLEHIAAGLTNQQIAETLIISPGTAKWYTSQIYSKLGVNNRTQAAARARELKIIE